MSKSVARRASSTATNNLFLDVSDLDLELIVFLDVQMMVGDQSLSFSRDKHNKKDAIEKLCRSRLDRENELAVESIDRDR